MDKLTAEQARTNANACKSNANNFAADDLMRVQLETQAAIYTQLADALEALKRAQSGEFDALKLLEQQIKRAEQAESRLKEAMRVMAPSEPPGEYYAVRGASGKWKRSANGGIDVAWWCDWANAFESAFGVKVEEWKP